MEAASRSQGTGLFLSSTQYYLPKAAGLGQFKMPSHFCVVFNCTQDASVVVSGQAAMALDGSHELKFKRGKVPEAACESSASNLLAALETPLLLEL